jgi:hypothetical protein
MENKWVLSGNKYFINEVSTQVATLPNHIFKVDFNELTGQYYLTEVLEKFAFPYKIYGVEQKFIDRVVKTYKNTTKNLGILLNGIKGTGKTVTAELLCNQLDMPVLIVHKPYGGIPSFMNEIQQDVIIFFDEYEKMYRENRDNDASILTIMDGVLDNGFRKVFLLTTNETYINSNLLQRPSRIRYFKTFTHLTLDVIMELVDDKLVHTELRNEVIEFISRLDTITIDIVKTVVDEVNIHHEGPEAFKDCFNVEEMNEKYNVFEANNGIKGNLIYESVDIYPKFTKDRINKDFRINDDWAGTLKSIVNETSFIIESWDFDEKDSKGNEIHKTMQITIEKHIPKHASFVGSYSTFLY